VHLSVAFGAAIRLHGYAPPLVNAPKANCWIAATRFRARGIGKELQTWLTAPTEKVLKLHQPFENGLLKIVLTGERQQP
jgi:hypothetical protein